MRTTSANRRGLRSALFLGLLGAGVLFTASVGLAQTEPAAAPEHKDVPEAAAPAAPVAAAPHPEVVGEPKGPAATGAEAHPNPHANVGPLVPAPAHHGGHAEGPVIENWWSWDYGPGPGHAHKNPPFGFALINFVVFLFVLQRLGGKSFTDFVRNRHKEVHDALGRAREAEQKAKAQLAAIETRTREVEKEVAALIAEMRTLAETERKLIVERAEQEAARLLKDAEAQARAAVENARRKLEQQAALLAIDMAEKLVKAQVNEGDQQRLLDRYVTQVEAMGRPARGGQS